VGALAVAVTPVAAASAKAATYIVGSPLKASFSSDWLGCGDPHKFGASSVGGECGLPGHGVIVLWRLPDASGGPFKLCVLTPDGGITVVRGSDAGRPLIVASGKEAR
jgi:hypothetical protein